MMAVKIINDPAPLSFEYLPEKVLHREETYSQLIQNIRNRVNSILFGPIGSGKTTLVRKMMIDLSKRVEARYVDCLLYPTEYSVLREILPTSRLIPLRSNYELIKELQKRVKEKPLTLFIDNFVRLKDPSFIKRIMTLGVNCVVIGRVDRNSSVLTENMLSGFPSLIKLDQYTRDETFDILKNRAKISLNDKAYADKTLRQITEKVRGNITLGINLLRAISLKAQSERKNRIENIDLEGFLPSNSDLLDLNSDEKTLLKILENERRLPSGRLFKLYRQMTQTAKGGRSFRNYMQRLCSLNLIRSIGENSNRSYQIIT